MWDLLEKILDNRPVITLSGIGLFMFIIGSLKKYEKFELEKLPRIILQISGILIFCTGLYFILIDVGVEISSFPNVVWEALSGVSYEAYLLILIIIAPFFILGDIFQYKLTRKIIENDDGSLYINVTNIGPKSFNCVAMLHEIFRLDEEKLTRIVPPATLFQWVNNPTKITLNTLEQNDFWVFDATSKAIFLHLNRNRQLELLSNMSYLLLIKIYRQGFLGKAKMAEVRGIAKIFEHHNRYGRDSDFKVSFKSLNWFQYLFFKCDYKEISKREKKVQE